MPSFKPLLRSHHMRFRLISMFEILQSFLVIYHISTSNNLIIIEFTNLFSFYSGFFFCDVGINGSIAGVVISSSCIFNFWLSLFSDFCCCFWEKKDIIELCIRAFFVCGDFDAGVDVVFVFFDFGDGFFFGRPLLRLFFYSKVTFDRVFIFGDWC